MARKQEPNSVATIVGLLMVNDFVQIQNKKIDSIAVMISQLKRKEENKNKKFKLKQIDGVVTVTRVI